VGILLAALAVAVLGTSAPAWAQANAVRIGDTQTLVTMGGPTFIRAADTEFDSTHNVYLAVTGIYPVWGRFMNRAGVPLGTPFQVAPSRATSAPAIAYSPELDAFLVTWIDEGGTLATDDAIVGRLVRFDPATSGPVFLTGEVTISANRLPKQLVSPPSVAWSAVSREFLVTWIDNAGSDVRARRVTFALSGATATASLAGNEIPVSVAPDVDMLPKVAYNPVLDEFFVAFFCEPPAIRRRGPGQGRH
jgi:hypothetical protein